MQEMLRENKERIRNQKIEEIKRLKREQKKERILTVIIGTFIMFLTITVLNNIDKDMMNDCTSAGHSQTYCERGI